MIIWNRKVYKSCFKSINKGLKLEIKEYFKLLHADIKRNFNHSIPDEDGNMDQEETFEEFKKSSEDTIVQIRNALVDLSLNYHNINFLEHSSFFKPRIGSDEFSDFESDRKRIFDTKNQETNSIKIQDDLNNKKMMSQPWFIFKLALVQESKDFFQIINKGEDEQDRKDTIDYWLDHIDASQIFNQSLGLKQNLIGDVCSVALKP